MELPNSDIARYWNDILTNSKLIGSLKCIEDIDDNEEMLFSLLMRVVFLTLLGLKKEKEEAKNQHKLLLNCFKSISTVSSKCGKNCEVKRKLSDYLTCLNGADGMNKDDEFADAEVTNSSLLNNGICFNPNESQSVESSPKNLTRRKILAVETQCNTVMNEFSQKGCVIPETIDFTEDNVHEVDQEDGSDLLASPSLLGEVKRYVPKTNSPMKWLLPSAKKSPNVSGLSKNKRPLPFDAKFELGVKNPSKKLKQTKISKDSFIKRSNKKVANDGSKLLRALSTVDGEEKARIQRAIEDSLTTNECEEMMREKVTEMNNKSPKIKTKKQWKRFSPVVNQGASNLGSSSSKELQSVSKNLFTNALNGPDVVRGNLRKSPKKSPIGKKSSQKSPKKFLSPTKSPSPMKYKSNSPRFSRPQQPSSSKGSKTDEVRVLHNSPKHVKMPLPKIISFEDSFDYVGKASPTSGVARKKCDRKALPGWSCHECRDYYESKNLNEEEKRKAMNICSRHRSKKNVINNTPKNFWNPEWSD